MEGGSSGSSRLPLASAMEAKAASSAEISSNRAGQSVEGAVWQEHVSSAAEHQMTTMGHRKPGKQADRAGPWRAVSHTAEHRNPQSGREPLRNLGSWGPVLSCKPL